MARRTLPDLDFVVDELLLEGMSGVADMSLARRYASALLHHVLSGSPLGKHAERLVRALPKITDARCRERTARALARHATSAGDEKLLARIEKVAPGVGGKAKVAARLESLDKVADRCRKVERACLAGRPVKSAEALKLVAHLGARPEGRGYAKVDLAKSAATALMRVLIQEGRRGPVRTALESALAGAGPVSHGARRALIAAAVYSEDWKRIDALMKASGPALVAAAAGMGTATYYRLNDDIMRRREPAFQAAIARFRKQMEPRLKKLASRGPAAAGKECEQALRRLERGR